MQVRQKMAITPMPNEAAVIFVADLQERVARHAFTDARHALLAYTTPCVLRPAPGEMDIELAHLEEFVCRIAAKKYAALFAHMSLFDRMSGIVSNLRGNEWPRDTVTRAISMMPPPRLDAGEAARSTVRGTEEMLSLWLGAWTHCDLSMLPGFPLWEEGVHNALGSIFTDVVYPVYLYYSRCKPESAVTVERGRSLGMDEWMQLVSDCKLAGRGCDLRALRKVHGHCVPHNHEGVLEARLLLPQFMLALATVAFQRANAAWLEAPPPGSKAPRPLPDCLVELLQLNIVPHAQRDSVPQELVSLRDDNMVQDVINMNRGPLEELHRTQWKSPDVPGIAIDKALLMLKQRHVFGIESVQQKSAVTGDPASKIVHRSMLDHATAGRCFVSASRTTFFMPDEDVDMRGHLSFEEFTDFICLLAAQKYGVVAGMSESAQVRALVANLLGEADTRKAIEEATFKSAGSAYDARSHASPLTHESAEEFAHWLDIWDGLRLSAVRGFPLWLRAVHDILHSEFAQLRLIFGFYVKLPGPMHMTNAPALTLDLHQLMDLAKETQMLRKSFEDTKLNAVAKQYMTTHYEHGATHGQLLFSDFLSVVVHVAFVRTNPRFEENAASGIKNKGQPLVEAPIALRRFLDECLMPLGKRDDRLTMRKKMSSAGVSGEEPIIAVIKRRTDEVTDLFAKLSGKAQTVQLDAALRLIGSRGVLQAVAIQQRSEITADGALLTVHNSALSAPEARRAFIDSLPEATVRKCEQRPILESDPVMQVCLYLRLTPPLCLRPSHPTSIPTPHPSPTPTPQLEYQ